MPSILTHYYFIKDTNKENIPFLENEEKACLLGAQGVDPFYYYGNILNRFNKEEVNSFAKHIHLKECASLYIHFIKEANKLNKEHKYAAYPTILTGGNDLIVDPNFDEEQISTARLTVTTDDNGNFRAMQKGGCGSIALDDLSLCLDRAVEKGAEIRKIIG